MHARYWVNLYKKYNLIIYFSIVGSLDPVAVDQCCLDLILKAADEGKQKLIDRIIQMHGHRILKRSEEHGIGSRNYDLETLS